MGAPMSATCKLPKSGACESTAKAGADKSVAMPLYGAARVPLSENMDSATLRKRGSCMSAALPLYLLRKASSWVGVNGIEIRLKM
jgi:hypothetical protein